MLSTAGSGPRGCLWLQGCREGAQSGFVVHLVCPDPLSWGVAADAGGTELLSSLERVPLLSLPGVPHPNLSSNSCADSK